MLTAHHDENAINQPHLNTFVKNYRDKYDQNNEDENCVIIEQLEEEELEEEEEESPENQQECVVIAYDDQNGPQIIHVDQNYQEYANVRSSNPSTSSTVIINHHSYT